MPCVAPPLEGVACWPLEWVDMPCVSPPLEGATGSPLERVDMPCGMYSKFDITYNIVLVGVIPNILYESV